MDINTGRSFASREHAVTLGVKPENLVLMQTSATREDMITMLVNEPELLVASGPFKGRVYKRTATHGLVRVRCPPCSPTG